MTRASLAGVSPRERRTSSARGTSTSTSRRASSCVVERHRLRRDVEVEAVRDDEAVDDVEVGGVAAVDARRRRRPRDELRLGIVRPVHRDQPELGDRRDELLAAGARALARDAKRCGYVIAQAARASRIPSPPPARTLPSACAPRSSSWGGPGLEVFRRRPMRPQRRVDLEQRSSGTARAPLRARGSRRAAPDRPRARRRPAGAASRASRGARRRPSAPSEPGRASPRRAAMPPGVVTRSGRRDPSG